MRCLRLALAFAATLFVVAISEAQPPSFATVATPTPLAVALLPGIDDPVVVAELKLSEEQVKTLVARRKELWDEAYTTAPNTYAEGAAARNEATDKLLKKTLSAQQYTRAAQLGAQSALAGRGGFGNPDAPPTFNLTRVTSTTLTRYPELAAVFKLTDEQKKQLAAPAPKGEKGGFGGTRSITVTKEQSDAAKAFLGAIAKDWTAKTDPRNATRIVAPAGVALLDAKDVRAELKLSEDEGKALAALAEKWTKLASDRRTTLSPKEADEQAAALKTESEKALGALKPEQATRLKQVVFQTNLSRGFATATDMNIESLYTNATVAKELAITEKQVEEFKGARQAFEKEAAAVLLAADAPAPAEKKLNELVAARRKKSEAVLTADQTAKLKALVGEPFTGRTTADRSGRLGEPREGTSTILDTLRAATFGHYSTELTLIGANKSIQEELKLDEKQIKQIADAQADITTKFRLTFPTADNPDAYAKTYADRSKAIGETLSKVLSEDQGKRFRQIMLQYRERPQTGGAFLTAVRSAVTYPGVAEEVKLTDDQKKKLLASTAPADVLTADQKSAIQKMLGEPFKGTIVTGTGRPPTGTPGSFPSGGGRGPTTAPRAPATVRLLIGTNAKAAEEALKLTEEQVKKVAAAREAYLKVSQTSRPGGFGGPGGTATERNAALRKAYEEFDKAVTDALTDEQKPRLAQLVVQSDAAQNLATTLTALETAKKLELTVDQAARLTALSTDATRLQDLRTTHIRSTSEPNLGRQMRDAADDRMVALLTDAQKKKWKELTGDPLPGLTKTVPSGRFGSGGDRGGFGGPPSGP